MELCKTVTTNRNNLSTKEQADLVRATAVPCDQRNRNIMELFNKSLVGTDPILKSFGIEKVSNLMKVVPAHVFLPPEIEYGQGKRQMVNNGRWDNMNKKFYETNINSNFKWIFINCTNIQDKDIDTVIDVLINVSKTHNMNIGDPQKVININIRNSKENEFERFFSHSPDKRYDLLIVALPRMKSEFYSKLIEKIPGDPANMPRDHLISAEFKA